MPEAYMPVPGDPIRIVTTIYGIVVDVNPDGTFTYKTDQKIYTFTGVGRVDPVRDIGIVYENREGCAAKGHDTVHAYSRLGCRCPIARELRAETRRAHYWRNRDHVIQRVRARQAERAAGAPTSRVAQYRYEDTEDRADWAMAKRILDEGPQKDATPYDRWMAIQILHDEDRWASTYIAGRVGVSLRAVERYRSYLRGISSKGKGNAE